jgi:protein FRA10AC1
MASFRSIRADIFEKKERRQQYGAYVRGFNAYERHQKFMEDYVQFYGNCTTEEERRPVKTDRDTLIEAYRFIRSEEDDLDSSWEQRLAKRYHDKLCKDIKIRQ